MKASSGQVLLYFLFLKVNESFGGIYTVYDVSDNPVNYTSAVDFCASVNSGQIPKYSTSVEQESLRNCSQSLGITENFWIHHDIGYEFPEEPVTWSCDYVNETTCFIYDMHFMNKTWDKYQTSSTTPSFDGQFYLHVGARNYNKLAKYVLRTKHLPGHDVCFIFYYRWYSNIGQFGVSYSLDLEQAIWNGEITWSTWTRASIDINSSLDQKQLYLVASRNNYAPYGYFDVDNIKLKYGKCSLYTDFPTKGCEEVSYSRSGSILFPNHRVSYGFNKECSWKIFIKKGKVLILSIHAFSLNERYDGYCSEYLTIQQADNAFHPTQYCGTELKKGQSISYDTAELRLMFFAYLYNDISYGFNISWRTDLILGIGVGIVTIAVVTIFTVLCIRRRRSQITKEDNCLTKGTQQPNQQRNNGVHNPAYQRNASITYSVCTGSVNTAKCLLGQDESNVTGTDSGQALPEPSNSNKREDVQGDDPYNHLNEIPLRHDYQEYGRCNEVGTYDHLTQQIQTEDNNDADAYDHAGAENTYSG